MKATVLDTATGKAAVIDGIHSWQWYENNWSCDCNRHPDFDTDAPEDFCEGCKRFIVVAAEFDDKDYFYTLRELNQGYPKELLEKYGIA